MTSSSIATFSPTGRPNAWGTRRTIFALCAAASLALSAGTLFETLQASVARGELSYIVLVLPISCFFFFSERHAIFECTRSAQASPRLSLLALVSVFAVSLALRTVYPTLRIAISTLTLIAACSISLALCYGFASLRAARFPLLFSLLLLPPSPVLLQTVTALLQTCTVTVANSVFHLFFIPVTRDGNIFTLRDVAVEVSSDCSGIRSLTVLLILAAIAAHTMLRRSYARKVLLIVVIAVLAIVKNGIRIVALAATTAYIDPNFLDGNFHQYGGIPLFLITVAIGFLLARWLQGSERNCQTTKGVIP